jgi:2-polyprenyl-3-methyl-5-hydroxy-6-metoxy-1,4-benzoquinol methylase
MNIKISDTLVKIGAIDKTKLEVFSKKTRDNSNLFVYRDKISKVIYIDDFYVGTEIYQRGEYRKDGNLSFSNGLEDLIDSQRRFDSYKQFIVSKAIVDFGCGAGSFLRLSKDLTKTAIGVELQQNYLNELNSMQIKCVSDANEIENGQDTIFLFHCLEHLNNPIDVLMTLRSKLKEGTLGKIVIEVPHAKDFLIETLKIKSFIDFTLWSQHLVLHTRDSLRLLLEYCGFRNIVIEGVQRYSIANHFNWLTNGLPGGHKEVLSCFETEDLALHYASALSKIDANDTLVAIATN